MSDTAPALVLEARMASKVSVPAAVALLQLYLPAFGNESHPAPRGFEEEVSVERVEVDIVAQDKNGKFVEDLSADDFAVFEDGKPVDVLDFELRDLGSSDPVPVAMAATSTASSSYVPPRARRFIVFVDLFACSARSVELFKADLLQFIDKGLAPEDEVMLAILAPDRRVLLLQKFTNTSDRLRSAIKVLRGSASASVRSKSQEDEIYQLLYAEAIREMGLAQSLLRIQMTADLVRNFAAEDYQRAAYSFNALASLVERVQHAGWEEGRKAVIYLSQGVSWRPGQALADVVNRRVDEHNAVIDYLSATTTSGGNLQSMRAHPMTMDYTVESLLDTTVGRLNRIGATLYTIDSRGIFQSAAENASRQQSNLSANEQASAFFGSQDSLSTLAADTGGVAFFNTTRFGGVFKSIEQDNRIRYFLTYQPPKHKPSKKPKFYSIKIQCKRPGIDVRARRGYLD